MEPRLGANGVTDTIQGHQEDPGLISESARVQASLEWQEALTKPAVHPATTGGADTTSGDAWVMASFP